MKTGKVVHIRSGELNVRARIDKKDPTETRDSYGGVTTPWYKFEEVWCKIRPVEGREYDAGERLNPEITHEVTLRYLKGVTPHMRLVVLPEASRNFDIIYARDEDTRGRETTLWCKEDF